MKSWRDALVDIIWPMAGVYLAILTLHSFQWLAADLLPRLETSLFPIVGFGYEEPDGKGGVRHIPAISKVFRDEQIGCFDIAIEKLGDADQPEYTFRVQPVEAGRKISDPINTAAYLTDEFHVKLHGKLAKLYAHKVGEKWTRHYCFVVPYVAQDLDILVEGRAVHHRHPFYSSVTPTPTFFMAAPGEP